MGAAPTRLWSELHRFTSRRSAVNVMFHTVSPKQQKWSKLRNLAVVDIFMCGTDPLLQFMRSPDMGESTHSLHSSSKVTVGSSFLEYHAVLRPLLGSGLTLYSLKG